LRSDAELAFPAVTTQFIKLRRGDMALDGAPDPSLSIDRNGRNPES